MRLRRRTRDGARDGARWVEQLVGRGVVPGPPEAGVPDPRHEALPVHAGAAVGGTVVLLVGRALLVVRGGRRSGRTITQADRVTWVADDAPALGDGRVAVAEPGGVALRRPGDPMQQGRRAAGRADRPDLVGRTVDGVAGGPVTHALVAPTGWVLLLADGTVVGATTGHATTPTPPAGSAPGTPVTLPGDHPVVVDRADGPVEVLDVTAVVLGPVSS